MANSYVKNLIHCVWSTKNRENCISIEWEGELWAYIGGIARNHDIHPIQIGGIENHIHALVEPPKTMSLSDLMKTLKGSSSYWINENKKVPGRFRWQVGYGAFSVSSSMVPNVRRYIQDQRKHHERFSFEYELKDLMKRHGIRYDDTYLLG